MEMSKGALNKNFPCATPSSESSPKPTRNGPPMGEPEEGVDLMAGSSLTFI